MNEFSRESPEYGMGTVSPLRLYAGKFLAAVNLGIWSFNLFGILIPVIFRERSRGITVPARRFDSGLDQSYLFFYLSFVSSVWFGYGKTRDLDVNHRLRLQLVGVHGSCFFFT
ncbi:unnamed protein product [Eruca vesicaria subsp. sativa]|uniref:DUF7733 domain-containing protein n=1 Tax=Eruca vesicaria subsp. sativa TaxID=29727 RepID=A0ABC8L9K5_ERUVS|nr:unnamed protein product [Eruca vesicaria subsp. sativa]